MPGIRRLLPTLRLHPAGQDPLPFTLPTERTVDRRVLADISPDRGDLLLEKSTDEIRQSLVLAVPSASAETHWLYQVALNSSALPRLRQQDSRSTRRLSIATSSASFCASETSTEGMPEDDMTRRVLTSVETTTTGTSLIGTQTIEESISQSKQLRLSTRDQLVSPRPLGPTHILIAYQTPSSGKSSTTSSLKDGSPRRIASTSTVHEIPINDLLFALNVPNLTFRRSPDGQATPPLPRRKHNDLPRVLLAVPDLCTFPELVVFLHNKDQDELFSKFVPGWVRELMQPLPYERLVSSSKEHARRNFVGRTLKAFRRLNLSRRSAGGASKTVRKEGGSAKIPKYVEEYLAAKVMEVVAVAQKTPGGDEVFVDAMTCLEALRANLLHVGYFFPKLWFELDLTRELLLRTISLLAQV